MVVRFALGALRKILLPKTDEPTDKPESAHEVDKAPGDAQVPIPRAAAGSAGSKDFSRRILPGHGTALLVEASFLLPFLPLADAAVMAQ